jgi:hypothetical protein
VLARLRADRLLLAPPSFLQIAQQVRVRSYESY